MEAAAPCALLPLVLLLLVSARAPPASALKLPSYIKPCSSKDPKLNECAYKHAQEAIPSLLKGDPKYNVPPLNPLKVSQIEIKGGEGSVGLHMIVKDASFYGFKEAVIKETIFDLSKKLAVIKASVPVGKLLGKYVVDGKILVLPIRGGGEANITVENLALIFTVHWELEKKDDGKEYIKPVKSEIEYDLGRAYIHLDGLFGGDKILGDNMNTFLNENWRDVVKELGPVIAKVLSEVVLLIVSAMAGSVPYNEVFPETA